MSTNNGVVKKISDLANPLTFSTAAFTFSAKGIAFACGIATAFITFPAVSSSNNLANVLQFDLGYALSLQGYKHHLQG